MNTTINITAPKTWNELTKKQLLTISRLFESKPRLSLFRVLAMIKLTGIKLLHTKGPFVFKYKRKRFSLSAEEFTFFAKKFDWLFDQPELTKNLLPVIKIRFRKFYGPADSLFNITFGEYLMAENYFSAYNKTKKIIFLDKLIATLYRPRNKNIKPNSADFTGDIREVFNDFLIDRRAKLLSKLPFYKKQAILMFYSGSVYILTKRFYLVFEESENNSVKQGGNKTLALNDRVSKEFGVTPDEARKLMLYDVMQRLEDIRADAKDLQSKINKK